MGAWAVLLFILIATAIVQAFFKYVLHKDF